MALPIGGDKAYNLLSRVSIPPPEGSLECPPVPAPAHSQAVPMGAAAAAAADAPAGVQLRRSSRPPRPTAAAAALAGELCEAAPQAPLAGAAPQVQPQGPGAALPGGVQAAAGTGSATGAAERLLMWVRPLSQRSGEHMMFEMVPAQPLPPGSWAQLLNPGSWCDHTVVSCPDPLVACAVAYFAL